MNQQPLHLPVLLAEVTEALAPAPDRVYVDCTLGNGGHSFELLRCSAPQGRLLGLDIDGEAVARARLRLAAFGERAVLRRRSYRELSEVALVERFAAVDGVVFDLGVSSPQLDSAERGFSFQQDAPLDMRFDQSRGRSAADLLNQLGEEELADIIYRYGEEPKSRRIARAIVRRRAQRPLTGTGELAALVAGALGGGWSARHPATRTFQALRIAVNDELAALEEALPQALALLRTGGRLAVITFHSLEDRLVKRFMQREARDCLCPPQLPVCQCGHRAGLRPVARKPVTAGEAEVAANPRSRSAKLRIAERLR